MLDKIIITLAGLALIVFVNVYFFGSRPRTKRPARDRIKNGGFD
jgi:hypothetical protein